MATSADEVWAALALGAVSFVGLLVGAIAGSFHDSPRFSGLLAAFGFGLLLLVDATTR